MPLTEASLEAGWEEGFFALDLDGLEDEDDEDELDDEEDVVGGCAVDKDGNFSLATGAALADIPARLR
jgi:hypothetical protein